MVEFSKTPERMQIVEALEAAKQALARAATLITKEGFRERADKTSDLAQGCANMKSLLSLDFQEQDESGVRAA